jgi:hypothetical protein
MKATPLRVPWTQRGAATLRLAASSVAPVVCDYERSLRPKDAGVSQPVSTRATERDR